MNWNINPEGVTLPSLYPRNQSSVLESTLMNTPSQGSLNSPRSNQPACMFLSNSNPVSQPLLNIRNYKTPQQISASHMHRGTVLPSQTSVERMTYANVKGPKQLNNNLQMSSGVAQNMWLNSPVRKTMFSHTGATVSQQTGFRTNTANVNALQNQFVTSDAYSMQVQMIPSTPVRVPVTYQGNQRLNSSLSEQQDDWAQQYTSNGLTYPDYRLLSEQYSHPSPSFLQDPALQKQNSMPPTSLQIKSSHPPNPALTLQSEQTASVQSYQYAVTQIDKRPPPPPYDYRYARPPLQNTQHIIKRSSMEVPQSQEAHLPEMRKEFCRGFQQQNLNENASVIGNFCNINVNANVSQSFKDPIRSPVGGVQILAQNNQEDRVDSSSLTSNQVLDTKATKEKLVRDIKSLLEVKKKFSELARKIKINKNVLMAAGCIKTTKNSYSESAQNSELSLKQSAEGLCGPQVAVLVTPETAEDKQPTVMETAEQTRIRITLNSNIQDTNCRNFNQVNSILLNSECSKKLPVPDQLHDLKVRTSVKTSTVESTHTTLSNTQFSSGNLVSVENVQTNSEITSVSQSTAFEEYASKYPNKNRLLLNLLAPGDKVEKLLEDGCEPIQDSKPHSFEMKPTTQITADQANLKTMETPSTCSMNAKISDNSFCLEHKSSTNGITLKNDSHCSMELLATCLSLWKKQPSEPVGKKFCNELTTNRTAFGISQPVEICDKSTFSVVGNSRNKTVNSQTTLPAIVQNSESSGSTITKGTELQIAVVSPLVLSDVKILPEKENTFEALPETVYPVIKEGSVCSLQDELAENSRVTNSLKVNEPPASISTNTKISSVIENEEHNVLTNANSEDMPNTNQGEHIKSEPDIHYLVNDQQASSKSRENDIVSSDLLQIDNICSLVEGDTSYNSQIAKIFNSSVKNTVPKKSCLDNLQVTPSRLQKEQLENIEDKDLGVEKDNFVQCADVSLKTPNQSKSLQPLESLKNVEANSEILEESDLEHNTAKESTGIDMCSPAAFQQDSNIQEMEDVSCNYTAQDPARNEIVEDKTPTLYPHDQLSELLKEFPYGIEAVNTCKGSVAQMKDQVSKDQSYDKAGYDCKDSTDQIKITILNSEQMKELFSEQNSLPQEVDKLTKPQEEDSVTKEGSKCDPQVHTEGESCDSVMDLEKDDVRCCALGWLAMEYEGVPQCQCNSIKNLSPKVEKEEDQCSLETNDCKQRKSTSDRDVPVGSTSPSDSDLKISLTCPNEKSHFLEVENNKNIKIASKTKNNSLNTELSGEPLPKVDKLDSVQSRKGKRKLKFHEETFQSSNKIKSSQESLQRKHIAQNSSPLSAKIGFLTNKDLHMKNGSLVQPVLPERRKLKAGNPEQKVLGKRKLSLGNIVDRSIKRMKCDKQQNKNGGVTISNFFLKPDERTKVKEKTTSNVKSSGSKESLLKTPRVLSQEYLQWQKRKEAMGIKASKKNCSKNIPCDSQHIPRKLSMQVGGCGKSNERHSSSLQTTKEQLNFGTSHGKIHSEGSKTYLTENVKEIIGGKQADKMWVDKTKLDKNLNNNGVGLSQMSPQAKEQRKQYLNRVAFKCTERESIYLTKLESLPKKLNKDKEKRLEKKTKSLLPKKDTTEKQSMLEFKLCPDGLINKSTNSVEEQKDLQPCPPKEQSPVQVTGIKSTKEDWIKAAPEEKRIPEANQEIDDTVLANSRNAKKTFSADGFEMLQNPVKDSRAMFQTYKKMYLEKRSRSLGSSPLK